MTQLTPNWITEGLIDVEYKKYVLLAYLQHISKNFDERKIYPFLADLIVHYRNLITLKENKQSVKQTFSRHIKKIDLENFRIEYEKLMHDDDYMEEIEAILNFAIPKMRLRLKDGQELYEYVEDKLKIVPVGIVPLDAAAGYMFLVNGQKSDTQVFGYQMTLFESASEKFRAIKTHFVTSYIKKLTNTYESIKYDLIRQNRNLPNPATFVIASPYKFPLQETFLPVAKRSFVRFLSQHY